MLCRMLSATKVAGAPDSHFHQPSLTDWLGAYDLTGSGFASRRDTLEAVFSAAMARGKGKTDIFGLRMQRGSFAFFIEQLTTLFPGGFSDVERIGAAFGRTLFIHLHRADVLGQAISRLRAEQTGLWHVRADGSDLERLPPTRVTGYDPDAIVAHMCEIAALNDAWKQWFDLNAIAPLVINYDALSHHPQTSLAEILEALGLDATIAQSVAPQTAKLADETSQDWRARFLKDRPGSFD